MVREGHSARMTYVVKAHNSPTPPACHPSAQPPTHPVTHKLTHSLDGGQYGCVLQVASTKQFDCIQELCQLVDGDDLVILIVD